MRHTNRCRGIRTSAPSIIIADGDGGYDATQSQSNNVNAGEGINLKGSYFQGGLIANKNINVDTTSEMQGPMLSVYRDVFAGQIERPDLSTDFVRALRWRRSNRPSAYCPATAAPAIPGWLRWRRTAFRVDSLLPNTLGMDLNRLLHAAVDLGASDIHLKVGQPPIIRFDGDLQPLEDWPALDPERLEEILQEIGSDSPARLANFEQTGEIDTAYQRPGLPRFRVNAFRQRGDISFAFRVIPREVPSFEALRLPPGVQRLAEEHRGLVLVTGATGSGKTTTLAAVLNHINRSRRQHIVTIEDPIEILHTDAGCIINQREVGLDTELVPRGSPPRAPPGSRHHPDRRAA